MVLQPQASASPGVEQRRELGRTHNNLGMLLKKLGEHIAARLAAKGAAPEARGQFLGDYMGMTTSGTTLEPFFMQSGTPPVLDGPTDAFFASVP